MPDTLHLGQREFGPGELAVMAIVNRTPDSFFDQGATFELDDALRRVDEVVAAGADIVDIGGVKAAPGEPVDVEEEIRRTVGVVRAIRAAHPLLPISVDTWRHEVGRAVCEAGADLLNDAWGGYDPLLASVAAEYGVGLVCAHAGGLPPRTPPHRSAYDDVMADVIEAVRRLAQRAEEAGVDPGRIVLDPAHDFAKNTWHSLEVTRRLSEMTGLGWPVMVAVSNKDFVGETLDAPLDERLPGTLAATAISAWQGATIFRAHHVAETRAVLDMVASIRGSRPPAMAIRGLA
jgi:dihydropteroate synthase